VGRAKFIEDINEEDEYRLFYQTFWTVLRDFSHDIVKKKFKDSATLADLDEFVEKWIERKFRPFKEPK
jgi:hypothetical protein